MAYGMTDEASYEHPVKTFGGFSTEHMTAALPDGQRGFMNAASPGVIALFFRNDHYATREEYVYAIADAMRVEYEAKVLNRIYGVTEALGQDERANAAAARAWCAAVALQRRLNDLYDVIAAPSAGPALMEEHGR